MTRFLKEANDLKLVPICHYCGVARHTYPNCLKLKSKKFPYEFLNKTKILTCETKFKKKKNHSQMNFDFPQWKSFLGLIFVKIFSKFVSLK